MTPAQQKYLRERLNTLAHDRIAKLPPKGLSKEDKERLFADKDYDVYEQHGSYYVRFPEDGDKRKAYDAAYQAILTEKQALLDQIMLSGLYSESGIDIAAALEAFANK